MVRYRPQRLLLPLGVLLLGVGMCAVTRPSGIQPAHYSYREARPQRDPALLHPGPAPPPHDPPPAAEAQTYPSGDLALQVWIRRPPAAALLPVILYLHSGTALEAAELARVQPFVDAGYAVVAPTWRGENGNPGAQELLYGEVDDAQAAVQWAAQQPGLDGRRMFAFGHEAGGVIAGMLSLYPELPLVVTASVSGLLQEDALDSLGGPLPFRDTAPGRQIRVFPPFFGQTIVPHIAYVGTQDRAIAPHRAPLEAAAEARGDRVHLLWLPGDRDSILPAAIAAFLEQISG